MRALFLVLTLAFLVAAQWALDPSELGYSGWTLTGVATSISATLQLLPTPYWQEWIIGNWTTAFMVGSGCTMQAGALRSGIYINRTAYVETPAVGLGQNFTVAVSFKPRYSRSNYGWVWLWKKGGSYWWGEASAVYGNSSGTIFYVADSYGQNRHANGETGSGFLTLIYVGMYIASQNTYYMQIYLDGRLIKQMTFSGQRGNILTSAFRLGGDGAGAAQQLWVASFAVYSRALSGAEAAAWRPDAPVGGSLVMYYYAHPRFVRDVDNDGVLEWLDLSGNNRHAKLRSGAKLQWLMEPVALQMRQCGGVALSAQWDYFNATYVVNATQVSVFKPGRVYFDGQSSYAVASITVYGWNGVTVEQYVYIPSAQKSATYNKFTCYGFWSTGPSMCGSTYPYLVSTYASYYFTTAVGSTYRKYEVAFQTDRWQHIVMTYNGTTRILRFYINGTLAAEHAVPSGESTVLEAPNTHTYTNQLVLGANTGGLERTQMAYSYVRIYRRALSEQEVRQNYASPNSPVTSGLELWMSWDSYRMTSYGPRWFDKIVSSRSISLYGTVFPYPHASWTVGAYLQHGYPAASPLVVVDFKVNNTSWTSGSSVGGPFSYNRAVQLARVSGAYVDASAYSGPGLSVPRYVAPNAAFGFDAMWTPSDHYSGWVTLWRVGATVLNITQVGGHGVSLNATSARGYAGVVAAVLGDGLYVNGTRRASLPQGSTQMSFSLLTTARGGLRALVRYVWIDAGVRYGANSSQTYGGFAGVAYAPSRTPSPWAYFADFRWWPPVSTWGVLQDPPFPAVRQRQPNQTLTPVLVFDSPQVSTSLWGPFGEICLLNSSYTMTLMVFGVRYVWRGTSVPTCVLPTTRTASGSVQAVSFSATVPIQLYFYNPPVQHPYVANSIPNARFCSANATDFLAPYLSVKAPGSTVVTDRWACAPSDYFVSGYAANSQMGWALIAPVMRVFRINTTSVIYAGAGTAVLAHGGTVPAMSARTADGMTWHIYRSGTVAVATTSLQTPPNVPNTGGIVSGIFGVPRSLSTILSVWWADGTRYYVTAAGLASDPVVYISSFTGSLVAVYTELNAPPGYTYHFAVLNDGTYVWGAVVSGSSFTVYVPTPGYYTVKLYRDGSVVWEKLVYLSPDARLTVGPIEVAVFTPVAPVSLYTPAAPKPPVFVPALTMEVPPYAVGILMLGIFTAAYVSTREVSLASLITGAVVTVLGALMSTPIYGAVGVFLLAFGLWNKSRRQGSI